LLIVTAKAATAGNGMKYKAVIFDLFGTLVDNWVGSQYEEVYQRLAELFGFEYAAFLETWMSNPLSTLRAQGYYDTFEECLREACRIMGVAYDPARVPQAVEVRMRMTRDSMKPRPDTMAALKALREAGCKIGLLSDCSWEVPACWPSTAMAPLVDEAIFSCTARLKKPDPRIYALICERLAVRPGECLYVGDCGSDELEGARRAGMDAALICVPYEKDLVMGRPEARRWDGPRVSSVAEVVGLVNGSAES